MLFTIEKIILCTVRVQGFVQAESMLEAMSLAEIIGTDTSGYSHEVISDERTIQVQIKEREK